MLINKNIVVGVTGSIAVYKTLELIRLYIKAGANVKVIMSESAKKFISVLTFETISQNKVLDDTNESWEKDSTQNHIAIGKWADIFVLAPASANTINKLANGIADNILTQSLLAYKGVTLLCPAANTNMLENPITKASIQKLQECHYELIASVSKELACRDIGNGAMSEVEDIYYSTIRSLNKSEYWLNRRVVLSGGGTIEKIDDVRYLSNFSSGKMASSLAMALYLKGADVTLVSTRGHENLPLDIHTITVQGAQEMQEHLEHSLRIAKRGKLTFEQELIQKKPYLFMVAAVSDYLPVVTHEGKLKKESLGTSWSLELEQNRDILSSLDTEDIVSVGFKAEMDESVAYNNAKKMMQKKSLDAVCLNVIGQENPFGSNENILELFFKEEQFSFNSTKLDISMQMLEKFEEQFKEQC